MWKFPRKRHQGLEIQGVDVDTHLEPLWEHLKAHLSESGLLSLVQGSVLWPSASVPLTAWLGFRKGGGRLPDPLSPLGF